MRQLQRLLPVIAAAGWTIPADAHDGHGASALSHFHASDAWGFVMLAACLVAALWWSRRK